ncbi:MAG: hypothetical protein LBB24_01460 [Rickettsiales bacterium]|jgi:hypothetical protein|nr:hypothetical protein [Rickettsiales bacterium]
MPVSLSRKIDDSPPLLRAFSRDDQYMIVIAARRMIDVEKLAVPRGEESPKMRIQKIRRGLTSLCCSNMIGGG